MNVNKLKKQFAKDLKKSPKKAGALGLLMVVGLWYWIPLAKQMLIKPAPPAPDTVAPDTASVPVAEVPMATVATATPSSPDQTADWQTKAGWLEQRTAAGTLFEAPSALPIEAGLVRWVAIPRRDPFHSSKPIAKTRRRDQRLESVQTLPVAPTVKPEDLGLHLDSTMVSGTARTALLNGRALREGAEFVVGSSHFVLERVELRHVVLRAGNRRFEVAMPKRQIDNTLRLPAVGL